MGKRVQGVKNVFISGITGTLGQAVMDLLLKDESVHVFGYSRDEKKQADIPPHPRLTLILGDVRDQRRLTESTRNMDIIFHFAALKRVDTLEENPEESIATNVEGTMNILGAQRANRVERVVLSSTDKACSPINVYGYCKALSEKLVLRNSRNVVVRYGNVLASRGSAVLGFIEGLSRRGEVTLTHKDMTRFFLTIDEAARFVLESGHSDVGGLKIYKNMKACKITDLISVIADCMGAVDYAIKTTGVRPGEKIHEDLMHEYELDGQSFSSYSGPQFTKLELKALIEPIIIKCGVSAI